MFRMLALSVSLAVRVSLPRSSKIRGQSIAGIHVSLVMLKEALRQDNTRKHPGKVDALDFIAADCPKAIAYEGSPFDIFSGLGS